MIAPCTSAADSWSAAIDVEMLRAPLQAAVDAAHRTGQQVLASLTLPVGDHDPLNYYTAAPISGIDQAFFWEQAAQRRALTGCGACVVITATSADPIATTADRWRAILADAVMHRSPALPAQANGGPLALGGFAFDPDAPQTDLWAGFPAGQLVVPEFLLRQAEHGGTLTITAMVDAATIPMRLASDLVARLVNWHAAAQAPSCVSPSPQRLALHDLRHAAAWRQTVADATQAIQCGAFRKVVLARGVAAHAERAIDVRAALATLRQHYPAATVFAIRHGQRTFMGATPEQLARVEQGQFRTMALAGSAPRGATTVQDEALGAALLRSEKNQGEHAIVTTTITDALAPLCTAIQIDDAPHLVKLANVQHLRTLIAGQLRPGQTVLDVVAALHPTPAVGGFPRLAALATIRATEGLDRGWYAGPVGWLTQEGDGEFVVALRSGLVEGNDATLFAGCGIVADSDPAAEYHEAALKLRPMLRALGEEA